MRLTVGQAAVRFLAAQRTERDGVEHRLIEGWFGIFGHGNVAGIGQALLEAELTDPGAAPYRQVRELSRRQARPARLPVGGDR